MPERGLEITYNEGNDAIRSVQVKQKDVDRSTEVDVGEGLGSEEAKKLHLLAEGRGRWSLGLSRSHAAVASRGRPSRLQS